MKLKIFKSKFGQIKIKRKFLFVSQKIISDKSVNAGALRVFLAIWANREGFELNQMKIGEKIGMTGQTVNRHLRTLSDNGYVYRCLYSQSDSELNGNKKYNYFFCDEGRAEDYYNLLVSLGFINTQGKIIKKLEKLSDEMLLNYEKRKNEQINLEVLNISSIKYINDKDICQEIKDKVQEKIIVMNNENYSNYINTHKNLLYEGWTKDDIEKMKTLALWRLLFPNVKETIDILITDYSQNKIEKREEG